MGISPGGPYHFYFRQLSYKLIKGGGRSNWFKSDLNQSDNTLTPEHITQQLATDALGNGV